MVDITIGDSYKGRPIASTPNKEALTDEVHILMAMALPQQFFQIYHSKGSRQKKKHAQRPDPKAPYTSDVRSVEVDWVLKVFKKETFLRHLESQLPQGLLQFHAAERKNWRSSTPKVLSRYLCEVFHGTLLEDGRFAFLMEKEHFDLHSLIDREMKSEGGKGGGPFSKEKVELMNLYSVVLGVEWLHNHGMVHRDLKASNVLVEEDEST